MGGCCGREVEVPHKELAGTWVAGDDIADEFRIATETAYYKASSGSRARTSGKKNGIMISISEAGWMRAVVQRGSSCDCYSGPVTSWARFGTSGISVIGCCPSSSCICCWQNGLNFVDFKDNEGRPWSPWVQSQERLASFNVLEFTVHRADSEI